MKGIINGGIASVDVQLSYLNTDNDSPIECVFEFFISEKTLVSKLFAQIGEKIVEASICGKEEAVERYDDSIAGGHAAVLGEKSDKKKNVMSLKLGNLLPGQLAKLNLVLLEEVEILGCAFAYSLPVSFFPDYKKHFLRS